MQTRMSVSTTEPRRTSAAAVFQALRNEATKGVTQGRVRRLRALLAVLLLLSSTSLAFADQFYFARMKAGGTSTGDEGATILVLWDDATGTQTLLSETSPTPPFMSHPVDGRVAVPAIATNGATLYGFVVDDTGNAPLVPFEGCATAATCRSRLVTVDPATGVVTYVGGWLDGYDLSGAGFDPSGRLWALDNPSGDVYQVDPTTGAIVGSPIDTNLPVGSVGDIDFVANGVGVVGYGGFAFATFDPNTGAVGVGSFSATNIGFDGALVPPYGVTGLAFTSHLNPRGGSPAATTCRLDIVEGRALDELGHVNDPWSSASPVAFREAAQLDPGTLPPNYMNGGPGDLARVGGSLFPACILDLGDAPDSYATTLASNGARHQIGGPYLGSGLPDIDPDGVPNVTASGDDSNGTDDEDGATLPTLPRGGTVQLQVTVGGVSPATRLQGWIDWGRDGSFAEAGDQVLADATVASGLNVFDVTVPATAVPGTSYARFRIANSPGLAFEGAAGSGEVEDYQVTITSELPGDFFPTCPINQQPPPTDFTIQQRWATPDVDGQRTLSYQTPVVGDLYGNGQPVVVVGADNAYISATVPGRVAKDLHIVNGLDGSILRTITTPLFGWSGQAVVAIADVDGDGQGEIVLKVSNQAGVPAAQQGRLIAYRNDGTVLWTSDQRFDYAEPNGRNGMALGFADFNGDGVPEVYVGTQIFNARTGARLVAATSAASSGCPYRGNFGCFWGQTTAVDMDGDGQLELLAGNVVYKVDMTNTSGQAGNSLSVWRQAPAVAGVGDGFTAVADMDLDGDPDVVVVRTVDTMAGGDTRIYVWDVETNTLMGSVLAGVGTVGGPPLIADIDGDGAPEVVIQNSLALRAFRFQAGTGLVPKWTLATNDGSGQTSLSMFDFNNDGAQELVYRDQEQLRIIDGRGATAVNLTTFPCTSGTATEMPVIAALDSTREARILVTCGTDASGLPGSRGVLRAFETASFPWANTRPVWNQQAYFVTHVNNDLTIPSEQYPHWSAFSDPAQTCSEGVNRPLNAFQQQVTDLDMSTGCPVICPIPARVTVVKTASPPDVLTPGGTITYTISVTNAGPGAAPGTVVQDPFPAGIASATWTCAASGGAVCPNPSGGPVTPPGHMLNETVATFPANGALTYTIVATVEATPPERVTNTVSVTGSVLLCQPGDTPPPCTSTVIVPPPVVELVITKTSAPKPAIPGDTLTYTITVVNNGPDAATGARVQDAVPAPLSAFTWTCTQPAGSCNPASGTGAIDTLVDLAAGAVATITLTGTLDANHLGRISNVATVVPPPGFQVTCPVGNPDCRRAPDDNDPEPRANLSIVKTAPASIQRGGTATYTLTVTNNGPSAALAVTLADPTPAGLVLVEAGAPCAGGFPCALGGLAPGVTVSVPVTLRVPLDYAGPTPIVNRACVSSEAVDPDTGNNCSERPTPLVEVADLQVTKTVDNPAPAVGSTVRFTITVRNHGPSESVNVALVDQLPAGLTFVGATPSQGTFDPATGRWAIGTIANGALVTLTIDATVTKSGPLANLATITETDTFDPDTSNNTAGSALNVDIAADLQVHKVADLTTVGIGSTVTFTITVRNAGPDTAPAVEVSDPLPAGLTFVSATPSAGAYDPATGIWAVGALANGGMATLQVTATVTAAEHISNTAQITGEQPFDPAPPNNSSGTTINGVGADLQVVKTADRTTGIVGDRVTFTIVVSNNGPGQATGVQVRESLPAGLTYVSSSASQGMYVPETGLWTVGMLTPPESGASSATLQVVADVTVGGNHRNVATIAAQDQPDPTPSNDSSGVDVETGALDLRVDIYFIGDADRVDGVREGSVAAAMAAAADRAHGTQDQAGALFDFFLKVTNVGTTTATGPITVTVPFPEEIMFKMGATDWACEQVGRLVSCTRSDLVVVPGQSFEVGMWGALRSPVPAGVPAYGTVTHAADINPTNDVATVLIKAPSGATTDLRVSQVLSDAGAPVRGAVGAAAQAAARAREAANGEFTATIDVTNQGADAAQGVSLQDVLPPGVTVLSVEPQQGTCTGTGTLMCELGEITPGQTIRVMLRLASGGQPLGHQVTVASRTVDEQLANNAAYVLAAGAIALDPARDTDGDGMTDIWESMMGLDPGANDAGADPDGDGLTNAQEAAAGTHPRGFYKQYFAEGVSNAFFGTAFDMLNADAAREAAVLCALMADTGEITGVPTRLGPLGRHTGEARDMLAGRTGAFSALIESDRPLATNRLTTWDARAYGSALETGLPAPSARWFFAEGATNIFGLFYLLQNPDMTTPAEVTVRYLLASGAPVTQTYTVAPHSRLTIPVNDVPGLASVDVSAEIVASHPIVAERAMYLSSPSAVFDAGHVGAGATSTSADWFFAEGATGSFFDLYLLLANPNPSAADVTVQYQLPDGRVVSKTYAVAAAARRTIIVKDEDPALAATSVAMAVSATQPIVAERAMWWPVGLWYEAHVVLGATATSPRWALAGGMVGGPRGESFYALIANQGASAGQARVTAVFDDGTRSVRVIDLPPTSRTTVDVATTFPEAMGRRLSVLIESVGATPVPLVVEGSRYSSADGRLWSAGGAMLGTRLP